MAWTGPQRAEFEQFYKGRRVCVTGGAGFIGAHLADALFALGARLVVIDDLSSGDPDLITTLVERQPDRVEFIHGSILDPEALAEAIQGVEHVFHLAAIGSVEQALADPHRAFAVNVHGVLRVAETARLAGVERLVYAASCSAYGDAPPPHAETAAPRPLSPYAASKLAGEHIVTSWARSRGLAGVSLRLFNVFGPRQRSGGSYAAVIPAFCDALAAGRAPVIYGDGKQTRDFVHVANVVEAMLLAAMRDNLGKGEVINVGSGRETSVLELAAIIAKILQREDLRPKHEPPRAGEPARSRADLTLARQSLGYEPVVDLEEGLEETIAWRTRHADAPSTGR